MTQALLQLTAAQVPYAARKGSLVLLGLHVVAYSCTFLQLSQSIVLF